MALHSIVWPSASATPEGNVLHVSGEPAIARGEAISTRLRSFAASNTGSFKKEVRGVLGFLVGALLALQPLEQIDDQVFDRVGHGRPLKFSLLLERRANVSAGSCGGLAKPSFRNLVYPSRFMVRVSYRPESARKHLVSTQAKCHVYNDLDGNLAAS